LLWFGHVFTSMAFWMDQVTRGWLIYELTDSTVQLGLVRGVQAIPILLLSPIAGSTADRYSRKTQILVAQIIDGAMFAALAILIFAGQIQPWHVYVTAFAMSIVQTFQQPARAAMISDVVPREAITNAIGLNSIIFNVARSTGPALAGVLIVAFGTGGAFATQAVFYILATYWTLRLQTAATSGFAAGHGHGESFARSILEGWKFSWRNLEVRIALLVVMFASLFIVPFTTLCRRIGPGISPDRYGDRRSRHSGDHRHFRRSHATRALHARRRGFIWPRGGRLRRLAVVSPFAGAHGDHRLCQCLFARSGADGDSNLLAR
jgi:MFS family permease